jgi:surfeit locus 1 family protein
MKSTLKRNTGLRALHWGWALAALVLFLVFVALGTWQVQRRAWKLDLIARVNQRVSAPATDVPTPKDWPQVNAANDEYRHVRLTGRFLPGLDAQVQAVTRIGSGYWLLSPLLLADGSVVWVNRGFVPPHWVPAASVEASTVPIPASGGSGSGSVTLTGLLRLTEPGGGFLRANDPAAGRWFSRDVAAISQAHGLRQVAPYFVDADATPTGSPADPATPVAGLTVIAFPNNHLVYALTWYVLALMVAGAAIGLAGQNAKHHDDPRRANPAD